jgi:hypothetical protein
MGSGIQRASGSFTRAKRFLRINFISSLHLILSNGFVYFICPHEIFEAAQRFLEMPEAPPSALTCRFAGIHVKSVDATTPGFGTEQKYVTGVCLDCAYRPLEGIVSREVGLTSKGALWSCHRGSPESFFGIGHCYREPVAASPLAIENIFIFAGSLSRLLIQL